METIDVRLPIKLGQFIKLANLAESGAQARDIIEYGAIAVNGEVETRRGRQLADGDIVTLLTDDGEIALQVAQQA